MIKEAWTQEEIDTAKYMHLCYLEATKLLNPKSYNKNAQKPFDKLTKEQQFIDLFIARKMLNLVGYCPYYPYMLQKALKRFQATQSLKS